MGIIGRCHVAVETTLLKGERDWGALHRIEKAAHKPVPGLSRRFY